MEIDVQGVCRLLADWDDILILAHQKPDGDAYGSAFALLWALEQRGKRGRVETPDGYDPRYRFIFGDYAPPPFEPRFVITADVAGPGLLGPMAKEWAGRIDLCIDHHEANNLDAKYKLVQPQMPATCQLVYELLQAMGTQFTPDIARAVYTGLSTDTGCFRFANVTAQSHRVAADMIDGGADHELVNKLMFETKSRGRLEIDLLTMENLEFHFDDRCAIITIPNAAVERTGVTEAELDGISAFPRSIEGVLAGVTLREKPNGDYRVSLRTTGGLDASAICSRMGGGGHKNASGCTVDGPVDSARKRVLAEIQKDLERLQ